MSKHQKDAVINWIEHIPKKFKHPVQKDKTFSKHLIKPNSMILTIGQTGSGKTNSVIDFLKRKEGRFYDIIIFTGSSKDEPLYNYLAESIDGLKLIDNVIELPRIDDYKESDNKDLEKLIVFDDSIMQEKKVLKEIEKWFMCARKLGFTCLFLSQDYHSVPPFIRRNVHYLQLFKLTDLRDMKNILSKHAMDVDSHVLKNMLNYATQDKGNFLTIAVNDPIDTKYRKNFIEILNPTIFHNTN